MRRVYTYGESLAESNTTNTSYQDKVSVSFTALSGKNYAIIASWATSNSDTDGPAFTQSTLVSSGDLVQTFSEVQEAVDENQAGTGWTPNFAVGAISSTGSDRSITLKIRYRTTDGADTAYIKAASILVLELTSDDVFTSATSRTTTTSVTYQNKIDWTPTISGDYYILASANVDASSTSLQSFTTLDVNGTDYSEMSRELNSTGEVWAYNTFVRLNVTNPTIRVQFANETTSNTTGIANAFVLALKASGFTNQYYTATETRTTTGNSYINKERLTQTPQNNLDHLILASAVVDNSSTTSGSFVRFRQDTTDFLETRRDPKDTDDRYLFSTSRVDGLSGVSTNWDIDYRTSSALATAGAAGSRIAVLQLNEPDSNLVKANIKTRTTQANPTKSDVKAVNKTVVVSENMSSTPSGTLTDDAVYDSGSDYVRLTEDGTFQLGALQYTDTFNRVDDNFVVSFEWFVADNGETSGDAIYFFWGCTSRPINEDEDKGGFIVSLDEYEDQIGITFAGSAVTTPTSLANINSGTWRQAEVRVTKLTTGRKIVVWVDGEIIKSFDDTTARTLAGDVYGFGARTGAAFSEHGLRRFVVNYLGSPNEVLANIRVPNTKANITKANIKTLTTQNNLVKANIKAVSTKANQVKAQILLRFTKSNLVKANIKALTTKNNLVKGNIVSRKHNFVRANMRAVFTNANAVIASIKGSFQKANLVKANIRSVTTKANQVKVNIKVVTTKTNTVKANILTRGVTKNNLVKSNIRVNNNTKNIIVKANVAARQRNNVVSNIIGHLSKSNAVVANLGSEVAASQVFGNIRKKIFNKTFQYLVYDDNSYVTTWHAGEVLTEPSFRTVINGGSGELIVRLARNFDNFGEDIDVKLANKVECWVFDKDAPSGLLLYTGFISGYRPVLDGHQEYIEITVLPYIAELAFIVYRDGTDTTIEQNSVDPSDIFRDIMDKYRDDGGTITYNSQTIDDTNDTVSYTFKIYTAKEALDKAIQLTPENWYWRIDADNKLYLKESNLNLADHNFQIGKHIEMMETWRRSEDIVNTVYFVGQETAGVPLYRVYTNAGSVSAYGIHATKYVDQRVSVAGTADIIANRLINKKKDPEIRTTLKILDNNGHDPYRGYDIESIKPGQTMKIRNIKQGSKTVSLWDVMSWDIDIWDQTLTYSAADIIQIMSVEYHPDYVIVEASSRLPEIPKRIEDINRNQVDNSTWNVPDAPTAG